MVAYGGINSMIAAEIMQEQELDRWTTQYCPDWSTKTIHTVLDFNDLSYAQKAQEKMESPDSVEIYLTVHAETAADAAMQFEWAAGYCTDRERSGTGCGTWKGTGESGVCGRMPAINSGISITARIIVENSAGKSRSHGQSEHGSAWGGLRLF